VKNHNKIHSNFNLNGNIFTSESALLAYTKSISREAYTFLNDWFNDKDFVEVQTSGSTGNPKVIKLKKIFMINSALATGTFFSLKEKTTALLCLSPNYIAGEMMLVRALVLGWHIDVVKPTSNPLESVKKQYDFCAMVPLQVQNSIEKLNQIKTLIVGGAEINIKLESQLLNLITNVYVTYGMTETITHIAVRQLNIDRYFKILPNVKIVIDSRDCLVIEAPKISDNKIITNDIVEIIDDNHFKWIGRFDNIINSGGVKIIPEKIEQKLTEILSFRFFITGVTDEKLGEKVVLICEGEPKKLAYFNFEKHLSKYEIPKQIFYVLHFIETKTKKINRIETLKLIT